MTVAPTDCYFPPVPRLKHLDRLTAFSARPDARELWTEVHDDIQGQLAALENDVRRTVRGVRVNAGYTSGEHFLLFSYRTFAMPDSDIDPVVVGITFTQIHEGINVEADVSGEQTGDCIASLPSTIAAHSKEELLATARESVRGLSHSADLIAAALKNPSRKVK